MKRGHAALPFLALLVSLTACGRSPEVRGEVSAPAGSPFGLIHPDLSGLEAAARGQLEARRRELEALTAGGGAPAAWSQTLGELGQLYHAYGLSEAALACYREAAGRAAHEPRWAYLAAVLTQKAGRVDEARVLLERTAELAPGQGAVWLRLGQLLLDAHRPAEAKTAFESARRAGQAYELAAQLGAGRAMAALGNPAAAITELEGVVRAAPQAGKARYALALVLRDVGRVEEAKRLLAQATAGEVTAPDPWLEEATSVATGSGASMRQGGEALMSGRLGEAEEAFRQAMAADPGYTEARRNLALALGRQGKHAEAQSALAEAAQRAPDDPGVQFDWGNALLATGDRDGAVARFERALALAPDYTAARFNLANALIALGRWDQALGHLRSLVTANPTDPKPRYLLAMGLAQRGQLAEAERRLRQLLAEDGKNVPALEGLAQVQMAGRRFDEAISSFELALALATNPASLSGIAAALSQSGRHREARERLERGLAAKAGEPAVAQAISLTLARLLATCPDSEVRDGRKALELAQKIYQAQPSLQSAETLAQALAAAGEVAKATELQQALLARMQSTGDLVTARRLAADLSQYLAGKAISRPLSP